MKIPVIIERVGQDEKYENDREILSFIALTCDSLNPIRQRVIYYYFNDV